MRRIIGVSAAALLVAACGSGTQGTVETEDGEVSYDVDQSGGQTTATFTGENGEEMNFQTGPGAAVNLPDGFSVYPGASVLSSTNVESGEGAGTMVMLQSSDSPDKLAAFYRKQAEDAGIEIKLEMKSGQSQILSGEGPDGKVFSVNASDDGKGGSTTQVTVADKM